MAKRRRRGPDPGKLRFWKDAVARQGASGLSVREFCTQRGLSEPSFYAWRRVVRELPPDESDATGKSKCGATDFAPITLADLPSANDVEIVLPGGVTVRVGRGCDAETLQMALAVLGR